MRPRIIAERAITINNLVTVSFYSEGRLVRTIHFTRPENAEACAKSWLAYTETTPTGQKEEAA